MRKDQMWNDPRLTGRPQSVLIVDDEPMVRRSVGVLLSAAGFRVFEAADGAEALDVLAAASNVAAAHERGYGGAIDLVLTDVRMPFGGVALVQELRARWPDQRVLFMSAFPIESLRFEGLQKLDAPFLAKPFNAHELLSKVWEALARDPAGGGSADAGTDARTQTATPPPSARKPAD